MEFTKKDIIASLIIGEAIIWLVFLIARNLDFAIPYFWVLIFLFPLLSLLGVYISFLIGKKFLILYQAAKFALVGLLNTFIDIGALNFLIFVSGISSGIAFSIFKGASFLLAVINSYFWNKTWTFRGKGEDLPQKTNISQIIKGQQFLQFLVISVIGLFINVGLASLVVNVIGPPGAISKPVWANIGAITATIFSLVWNFLGYKFIVFKK